MPDDLISRADAKAAIADKLRFHRESLEKLKARHTVHESHVMHAEGVVNGLEVALAALDKLPALDADGRWEKLREIIKEYQPPISEDEFVDGLHHACQFILDGMDRLSAPPAAERRPAVEDGR